MTHTPLLPGGPTLADLQAETVLDDAVDGALEACLEKKKTLLEKFGIAAGGVVAMRKACAKLPKGKTACMALVAGIATVCIAAGEQE